MSDLPEIDLDQLDLDLDYDDVAIDDVAHPLQGSDSATADAHGDDVKFGGAGCDCSFNPNTCGAGFACRWQRG